MIYAGIGSRRTPPEVIVQMTALAALAASAGWRLRSGHADGADLAFERGAGGQADIFLPWPTFNDAHPVQGDAHTRPAPRAFDIAARHHPAWDRLGRAAQSLHARNSHQVLGADLASPADLVLCWTRSGGGTQQALRIAQAHDVPVLNLWDVHAGFAVQAALAAGSLQPLTDALSGP